MRSRLIETVWTGGLGPNEGVNQQGRILTSLGVFHLGDQLHGTRCRWPLGLSLSYSRLRFKVCELSSPVCELRAIIVAGFVLASLHQQTRACGSVGRASA